MPVAHPMTSDCVARWSLDETTASDDAADATGNGHTGVNTGGANAAPGTGVIDGARVLGGVYPTTEVELKVAHHANLNLAAPFTVACWVYVPTLTPGGTDYSVIQKWTWNDPYNLKTFRLGVSTYEGLHAEIEVTVDDGTTDGLGCEAGTFATSPITSTGWHHVMGTFDSSYNLSIYIDGVFGETVACGYDILHGGTNRDLYLGRDAVTGGAGLPADTWLGDDIAIYNTAKDATFASGINSSTGGAGVSLVALSLTHGAEKGLKPLGSTRTQD